MSRGTDNSEQYSDASTGLPQEAITERVLSGMFWLGGSSGVQSAMRIGVVAVLARLLFPEDFGLMGAAMIVMGLLPRTVGVGRALVQLAHIDERHKHAAFTFAVMNGFFWAGLVWAFDAAIADFFRMPRLASLLSVLAWLLPVQALGTVSNNLISRELEYEKLAGVDVLSYSVYGPVGILLAYLDFGVWALVWAQFSQKVVRNAVLFYLQPHSVRPRMERKATWELIYYGAGHQISGFLSTASQKGDNIVAGRWLGADGLGIYGRAYGLMNASNSLLGGVLNKVLFPAFAKAQGDRQRLATAYRRGLVLVVRFVLPVSLASIVLAPELVDVLLGDKWEAVVLPFRIMAVGMTLRIGYKINGTLASGTGAVYSHAWRKAVHAFAITGGAWLGHHAGVPGIALSTLVVLALVFALGTDLALRITGLSGGRLLRACLPAALPAAAVGAATWGVAVALRAWSVPSLLVLAATFLLVSGLAVAAVWVMPRLMLGREGLWLTGKIAAWIPAERPGLLGRLRKRMASLAEAA